MNQEHRQVVQLAAGGHHRRAALGFSKGAARALSFSGAAELEPHFA